MENFSRLHGGDTGLVPPDLKTRGRCRLDAGVRSFFLLHPETVFACLRKEGESHGRGDDERQFFDGRIWCRLPNQAGELLSAQVLGRKLDGE
ncbi:MAG: hypothetical protein ACK4ZJ_01650 [Allorhizobium sp.]|uniref:hypothetical protein n=1 Tax=Rhizobium TaxID=379 RepID=UPI001931A679|nr:hypothetical protein [Rhizobium rosettiformans]